MVKIVLVAVHRQEANILKMVFQQLQWSVRMADATANNYLQFMQYKPEIIMMEVPNRFIDQIASIKLIKKNKQLKDIPIICYGNHTNPMNIRSIMESGASKYLSRPLKIGEIYGLIDGFFQDRDLFGKSEEKQAEKKKEKDDEFAMLLDNTILGSVKLEIMQKHIGKLLAFPFTITKIVEISGDKSSGAGDLAKVIASDSAISANILKVANSVHFATRDQKIETLRDAIVRIGFEEVKKIALSLGVLNILDDENKSYGFSRLDFWYHSLSSALIAEKIAKGASHPNPAMVFLAGLLHEFGVLLIDEFFAEVFSAIIKETTDKATFVPRASETVLGINHIDLVTELFTEWNMPDDLKGSIQHHLNFNELPELKDSTRQTALCIGVGNIMARSIGMGKSCDEFIYPIKNEILQELKLSAGPRDSYFDKVRASVKMYASFLGLENKQFPENAPAQMDNQAASVILIDLEKAVFSPHLFYMETLGYRIQRINKIEDLKDAKESHIFIFNCGEKTSLEEVEPWVNELPAIPVLLFYQANPSIASLEFKSNSKAIEPYLDVKMIDLTIQALITNESHPTFKSGPKVLQGRAKKKTEESSEELSKEVT